MAENFRGLVISSPIRHVNGRIQSEGILDPQEVRFALLLWDKIDYPTNSIITASCDTSEFLEDVGVLQRSRLQVGTALSVDETTMGCLHLQAYRQLEAREPGCWSMSRGERSFNLPAEEFNEGRGVLVSLNQAIPVPDKDAPLHDILEFRERRRDELLALRYYLDAIYFKVISAGDGPFALNSEVAQLDRALKDHLDSTRGCSFDFIKGSLDSKLNLLQVPTAVGTFAVSQSTGQSLFTSVLAVLGTGVLQVYAASALSRPKPTTTPFQYVSSYHREIFL